MEHYARQLREAMGVKRLPAVVCCALKSAVAAHAGVFRKSGEPYVTHPVEVACIVTGMIGRDDIAIAAALLHDVLEDTDVTRQQLVDSCGEQVVLVVEGVTKLGKLDFPSAEQAQIETYRKMVIAMAADVRVIFVKLADRLHNLRTIEGMSDASKRRNGEETLRIYAPIAHRLGIHRVKAELEDRSFALLQPEQYELVKQLATQAEADPDGLLARAGAELAEVLADNGVQADVTGRVKHLYSIHQKMVKKGQDFDEVNDVVALRVTTELVRDCYATLGLAHAIWDPIAGRFKDYIAAPKLNGYQSLHTGVVVDERPLEIQIRTHEMHRDAEYGLAAHFAYKQRPAKPAAQGRMWRSASQAKERREGFLSDIGDSADGSSDEFFEQLVEHLAAADEVYVYTPAGEVKVLAKGATSLDYAYAVHTNVGHSCVGARVNGKMVPFSYVLRTGDTVEVMTKEGSEPSRDWLALCVTPRARQKIRTHLSQHERIETEHKGRSELESALRSAKLRLDVMGSPELAGVIKDMGFKRAGDFYAAVGSGQVTTASVVKHLRRNLGTSAVDEPAERRIRVLPALIGGVGRGQRGGGAVGELVQFADGTPLGVAWQLARCCLPINGDRIIGHVQSGKGLVIHRLRCPQLAAGKADPASMQQVAWAQAAVGDVRVHVQGEDRSGLLEDVSAIISKHGMNIVSHEGKTQGETFAFMLHLRVKDRSELERMLASLRSINGVSDAWREGA